MNRKFWARQFVQFITRTLIVSAILIMGRPGQSFSQKYGRALADSFVHLLKSAKEDTGKVLILCKLGHLYSSEDADEGLKYANQALTLARKLEWEKGIASAYNDLGACYWFKSDFRRCLESWDKSLEIFEKLNDKDGILRIVGNKGVLYMYRGDYSGSLENCLLALKYAEELGDSSSIALNWGNIGSNYEYLKDYPKAMEFTFKALGYYERQRDTQSIASFLVNAANIYSGQLKHRDALKYQLTALKYNEHLGENMGVALNLVNVGSIYTDLKKYDSALVYLNDAFSLSVRDSLKITQSRALHCMGVVLVAIAEDSSESGLFNKEFARVLSKFDIAASKNGLLSSAISKLKKSIAIDLEVTNLDELRLNYYYLSRAQDLNGEYKAALESHKKYLAIKDSVFSEESKIKIANLETKRELDLKNKQLEINRLEVEKKRNIQTGLIAGMALLVLVAFVGIRNMKLAAARELSENKLNAFQARMNPHFIFNSLNTIQSLILNNETIPSIKYLSEFSKLMRQVLDNSAKTKVLLKDELQMLRSYIVLEQLRYDNFKWELTIAENVAESNIFVPGMIVQPFVENAIVHAFQPGDKNGVLNISIERNDRQIVCVVDDNGIGRQRSYELNRERNKDRQSHGINIATSRLSLLNNKKKGLVNKVIYEDKYEDGIATGTKVTIQLPIL